MQGIAVFVGVNGNRANAEFGCAAKNTNGDFASIGNKKLFDRFHRKDVAEVLVCERAQLMAAGDT